VRSNVADQLAEDTLPAELPSLMDQAWAHAATLLDHKVPGPEIRHLFNRLLDRERNDVIQVLTWSRW
jgi:hypothetical protein